MKTLLQSIYLPIDGLSLKVGGDVFLYICPEIFIVSAKMSLLFSVMNSFYETLIK